MKTLASYKSAYQNAKTQATRTKVFNRAYLNLSRVDFQEFITWQTQR